VSKKATTAAMPATTAPNCQLPPHTMPISSPIPTNSSTKTAIRRKLLRLLRAISV